MKQKKRRIRPISTPADRTFCAFYSMAQTLASSTITRLLLAGFAVLLCLDSLYAKYLQDPYHFSAARFQTVSHLQQSKMRLQKIIVPQTTKRWKGHLSAQNFTTPKQQQSLSHIRKNIRQAMKFLPPEHIEQLTSLTIKNKYHTSRGLANGERMILNTGGIETDSELQSVFIHEMGHVVDLSILQGSSHTKTPFHDGQGPVKIDDPSAQFYQLSWRNNYLRKTHVTRNDFVSGYAMYSPYEDFSESYLFYRLHGEKFRKALQKSPLLKQKYDFLRKYAFGGQEFQIQKAATDFIPGIIWDATLLKID